MLGLIALLLQEEGRQVPRGGNAAGAIVPGKLSVHALCRMQTGNCGMVHAIEGQGASAKVIQVSSAHMFLHCRRALHKVGGRVHHWHGLALKLCDKSCLRSAHSSSMTTWTGYTL